jgi:hypothetical protein
MAKKSTRSPLGQFLAQALKMARRREVIKGWGSDDSVNVAYLEGLFHGQNGKCFHTGEQMTLVRGLVEEAVVFDLCTMDRIDNTKGYTIGNIVFACDGINRMRSDMPLAQFRNLCKRIGMVLA